MALSKRAQKHISKSFEARAASIAAKHVRPEHVDSALHSLARGLAKHVPDLLTNADLHPSELDDGTLDAHFRLHAARHPDRVVGTPTQAAEPSHSLANAQDAAIAARTPSVRSRMGTNTGT